MTKEEAIEVYHGLINTKIKEAFEFFAPELAGSEDERIRRTLVEYFGPKVQLDFVGGVPIQRIRDWLEKQKEPVVDKEGMYYYLGGKFIYCGCPATEENPYDFAKSQQEKRKEQKPLSTEETELNSIAFLEQMGYTCIPPKKEHQNNSDAPKNALGGALNSPLDKDKNLDDIAQDYVEAVKDYNPEPTWDLMQTAVCYGYHYREGEEQKPAEWSEGDEEVRKDAIKLLEAYYTDAIEDYCPYNAEALKKLIDFLKSLRSWKPSEEQLAALHTAAYLPEMEFYGGLKDKLRDLYEQLKGLI